MYFFYYYEVLFYTSNLANFYMNPPLIRAVIYPDWQFYQVFDCSTIIAELDFKSEYLSRMCSVVTNPVMSLNFQRIRCATMLFHFGQTRNGYGATRFVLFSSTAESSAKNAYVVAPERSGQSESWAGRNVERTTKKPSFVPNSGFNRCSMSPHVNIFISLYS